MVKVKLIAYSKPIIGGDPRHLPLLAFKVSTGKLHDKPIEYYLSEEYPNEKVKRIILAATEFPSILEHIVLTFIIEDISRVCSHQLVRHRLASFTQESQRYSESYMRRAVEKIVEAYTNGRIGSAEARDAIRKLYQEERYSDIIEAFLNDSSIRYLLGRDCRACRDMHEEYRKILLEAVNESFVIPKDIKGKELTCFAEDLIRSIQRYYELLNSGVKYEDARFIIPQAVKTRLMVTVNLRELLHIACLRLSPKAQWEIREVVEEMIKETSKIIPEVNELVKSYCRLYGVR